MSSITRPYVILNLYDILFKVYPKISYLAEYLSCSIKILSCHENIGI